MNPTLLSKCQEVLEKIKQRPTSEWFMEPVDPEEDDAPNYYEFIKKPSDLSSVQQKLTEGQYKDVASFKEDLGLIWSNCIKYYGEESILGTVALDMKQYSEKLLVFLSDSPDIDWINELVFLVEELSSAVKPLNFASFSGKKRSSSTSTLKQYDLVSNDEEIEEVSYTQEQIDKLADDIGAFTSEQDIMALYNCLKENQPRIVGNKPCLTLNIANLPSATLTALFEKVEELKRIPETTNEEQSNDENESSASSRSTTDSSRETSSTSDSSEESTESD